MQLLKRRATFVAFVLSTLFVAPSYAQDATAISGKIARIGIFKNGLAAVEERFEFNGSGRYVAAFPPNALHGSFFISSDADVSATTRKAETSVPLSEVGTIDWTKDFQGRALKVVLPGDDKPSVVHILPSGSKDASPSVPQWEPPIAPYYSSTSSALRANVSGGAQSSGVFLQCENGETRWIANPNELRDITFVDGAPLEFKRMKDQIVFDARVTNDQNAKRTISLFYLTKGIAWAPQYRVETQKDGTLALEQTALVLNDWADLADVDVALYSGFPQFPLQNVPSPIDPNVQLDAFLTRINSLDARKGSGAMMSQMVSNLALNARDESMNSETATSSGSSDGVDIIERPIGKLSLKKGERAYLSVGKGTSQFNKIVCWNIADARDEYGRLAASWDSRGYNASESSLYGRTTSGTTSALRDGNRFEEPWDAIEFANPLSFPITTGPAVAISAGRIVGQNTLYWTNPKEKTLLPITKALSVRVSSIENERLELNEQIHSSREVVAQDIQAFVDHPVQTTLNSFASSLPRPKPQTAPAQNENNPNAENVAERSPQTLLDDTDATPLTQRLWKLYEKDLNRESWGETISIKGSTFRIVVIDAEITLTNQRDENTTVRLSRQYSGTIVPESVGGFDDSLKIVKISPVAYGQRRFNSLNEIQYEFTLQPRETKVLKFSYETAVRM